MWLQIEHQMEPIYNVRMARENYKKELYLQYISTVLYLIKFPISYKTNSSRSL